MYEILTRYESLEESPPYITKVYYSVKPRPHLITVIFYFMTQISVDFYSYNKMVHFEGTRMDVFIDERIDVLLVSTIMFAMHEAYAKLYMFPKICYTVSM